MVLVQSVIMGRVSAICLAVLAVFSGDAFAQVRNVSMITYNSTLL